MVVLHCVSNQGHPHGENMFSNYNKIRNYNKSLYSIAALRKPNRTSALTKLTVLKRSCEEGTW